ncbi:hypothetical protein K438DRAFT_2011612 [Mycena galopus ATCC 62051]|nr:hypothetical protein K438DRAFT_2011612 [Mycena galopus ATCC 62051]
MKITIKTTQQKVFQIDAELEDTVAVLKAKIQDAQGHPTGIQKIIYSGKVLPDDKTVESCGIKEKDFLVLMVSKPKPTPSPLPAASTSAPEPAPAAAQPAPAALPAAAAAAPPPAADPAPQQQQPRPQHLATPRLANMVEMGFPRDQVMRAMRASFNNPDRAVEYLMSGIPAHLEGEASGAAAAARAAPAAGAAATPAAAAGAPAAPAPGAGAAAPAGPQNLFQLAQQQQQQAQVGAGAGATGAAAAGAGGELNLAALQNNPQIQQLRELMMQNPALIQPLIQQLGAQNPALMQMIQQNPAAVAELFGVPGAEGDFGDEDGPVPPGAHVVSVTEEERAAIQRLEALGFPRQAVLEAYFACDKNEELAANYLFDRGFDDN